MYITVTIVVLALIVSILVGRLKTSLLVFHHFSYDTSHSSQVLSNTASHECLHVKPDYALVMIFMSCALTISRDIIYAI